jgi:hypothetical protein
MIAGLICGLAHLIVGHYYEQSTGIASASQLSLMLIVWLWILFIFVAGRSHRAFVSGEFKRQTMHAFYDSLRQGSGNSPTNQI